MRDHIYEYVFPASTHVALISPPWYQPTRGCRIYCCTPQTKERPGFYDFEKGQIYTGLSHNCRQLHEETKRIHWDKYTFSFNATFWTGRMLLWLHRNKPISLLHNLKHVEIDYPLFFKKTRNLTKLFIHGIFKFLNECQNLESFTIRNGGYVNGLLPKHLDGISYANDYWLEAVTKLANDVSSIDVFDTVTYCMQYVWNRGPRSKLKRKMIFEIEPSARVCRYMRGTDEVRKLNRWLSILHHHWGGELWFNNTLIRSDEKHIARVTPSVGGPYEILAPGADSSQSIFLSRPTAPVGVTFRTIDNVEEEKEWLGPFNDVATRFVNQYQLRKKPRQSGCYCCRD